MFQLPSLYVGVHLVSKELADLVGDLQKFFLGRGFNIVVDDDFGPKTQEVVRNYQATQGLQRDGRVGPRTWGALLIDGFRPKGFEPDAEGYDPKRSPNWPPRPSGIVSPNGLSLFGQGFRYQAKPLPSMREYVEADPAWVKANIGTAQIPLLASLQGSHGHASCLFNRHLIEQLETLFRVWAALNRSDLLLSFGGAWVTRFVRGSTTKLSNHAVGSAIDLNAAWNPFRTEPALVGDKGSVRRLVMVAYHLGFFWGGWYNDGMHFEAYKKMTTDEISRVVDQILKGVLEC